MRINTNVMSLTAQEASANTNKNISSSLEKLGSGLKINKAADDASGLAIADKLRTQASSIKQGIANANSATALIQIADKAMAEQSNILDVVKTKLIQAGTSTTSADGREAIRKDISKLLDQFDSIAAQTNYNGVTLLQKSATDTAVQDQLTFQLGEDKTFDVTSQSSKASNTGHLGGGSDTITGNSIVTADGGDSTNNIAVAGSQQINTSGAITIASVDLAATGAEEGTCGMNITLSGNIGTVYGSNVSDLRFDASSETEEIKTALEIIGNNNTSISYNTSTNIIATTGNTSINFGDLEFSSLVVTQQAGNESDIMINYNGSVSDVTFTVTNNQTDTTRPLLGQLNIGSAAGLDISGGKLLSDLKNLAADGLTSTAANDFMQTVDEALTQMNTNRSDFGSTQNQLESSIRNMQTTHTNLKNAESVIRDVDYAAESANFNKQNIIAQAGTYAMSQANAAQQNVMRLLQ
jgi:flagellin